MDFRIKALPLERSSNLPRFLSDNERTKQANGRDPGVTEETLKEEKRQYVKELLEKAQSINQQDDQQLGHTQLMVASYY